MYNKSPEFVKRWVTSIINFGASKAIARSTGGRRAKKIFNKFVDN
jgi:hypothetical protein